MNASFKSPRLEFLNTSLVTSLLGIVAALLSAPSLAAAAPGSFDTTFNAIGKVVNLTLPGATSGAARAVKVLPDGKILVAGECAISGNKDFCLARLTSVGVLDNTFVGPNAAGTGPGTAAGFFKFPIDLTNDSALAITVQTDGKTILAGGCQDSENGGTFSFCLARLKVDGSFDDTFDGPGGAGNGRFVMSLFVGDDRASALAIQPADGRILVAGSCKNSANNFDFCVARLLQTNGALDTSFGATTGFVVQPISTNANDEAVAIAVEAAGKIVIAGACRNSSSGKDNMCITRLASSGTLDTTFGGPNGTASGRVLIAPGGDASHAAGLAIQSNGAIVVAGDCNDSAVTPARQRFCLVRLNGSDGTLDASFDGPGAGGVGVGSGNGQIMFAINGDGDVATGLQVDAAGSLLVTGNCLNAGDTEFCVARLASNGSFDTDYDGSGGAANGRFSFSMAGTIDVTYAATLDSLGRLTMVGSCYQSATLNYSFCLVRLTGGDAAPSPLFACGLDLDGSQEIHPESDGVLLLRWMLGLRGSALSAGALGNGATRDAAAINAYAQSQLGKWNVDGDAGTIALRDGLMLLRAMLGMRDGAITIGAMNASGSRGTTPLVQSYLDAGCQ